MSEQSPLHQTRPVPVVRAISITDISAAFSRGVLDFLAAPVYGIVFGGFYAAGGMIIVLSVTALDLGYLVYPLAAGFALIGPFAAVGLYEVSRSREAGLPLTWRSVLSPRFNRQLVWMGLVTLFFFVVWMYQVQFAVLLGTPSFATWEDFLDALTMTPVGLMFLSIGLAITALVAMVPFSVTMISFPLLLDRGDVDFVTAMVTSVRAVLTSPLAAIAWAMTILILLIIACLPFFLGLVVVLPILGHTTWHLYRKIVVS